MHMFYVFTETHTHIHTRARAKVTSRTDPYRGLENEKIFEQGNKLRFEPFIYVVALKHERTLVHIDQSIFVVAGFISMAYW